MMDRFPVIISFGADLGWLGGGLISSDVIADLLTI